MSDMQDNQDMLDTPDIPEMDTLMEKNEKLHRDYDEKYAPFFRALAELPRGDARNGLTTPYEDRWNFVRNHPVYLWDEFILDTMKQFSVYSEINGQDDQASDSAMKEESSYDAWKRGNMQDKAYALVEAVRETAKYHYGQSLFRIELFTYWKRILNKTHRVVLGYEKNQSIDYYDRFELLGDAKKQASMGKLHKLLVDFYISVNGEAPDDIRTGLSYEQFLALAKKVLEGTSITVSESVLETFYFSGLNDHISINTSISSEHEGEIGEIQELLTNENKLWGDTAESTGVLEALIRNISDKLRQGTYFSVKQWNVISCFFTKDIFSALKLDENGKKYLKEPAGNPEIYDELFPVQAHLMGDKIKNIRPIFDYDYMKFVFGKCPQKLVEAYTWLLLPHIMLNQKELADYWGVLEGAVTKRKAQYAAFLEEIK